MKLLLKRVARTPSYTISHLYKVGDASNEYICDTIEDTDRGLTSSMTESEIVSKKINNKTAIPYGTYNILMNVKSTRFSNYTKYPWTKKYLGMLPRLENVKGFAGVLIHVGNTEKDTEGCLIVGYNKKKGMVISSKDAFAKLMDSYLIPCKNKSEKIVLTIEK